MSFVDLHDLQYKKSVQDRLNFIEDSVSLKAPIDPENRMPNRPLSRNQWMGSALGLVGSTEGGVSSLADATDTEIIAPQENQVLTFDHDILKWIPRSVSDLIALEPNEYGDIDVGNYLASLGTTGWQAISGFADAITNIGNSLYVTGTELISSVQSWLNGLDQEAWRALGSFEDAIRNFGDSIWQTADEVLASVLNWYNTTNLGPIVWLRTITDTIGDLITDAGNFVMNFKTDPFGTLSNLGAGVVMEINRWLNETDLQPIAIIRDVLNTDTVRTAFRTGVEFFTGLGEDVANAIKVAGGFFEGLGDDIADAIEDAGEFFATPEAIPAKLLDYLTDTGLKVGQFVNRLFNSGTIALDIILREVFGSGVEDVNSWLQGRKTDIITALGDAGTWLNSFVDDTGDKISEVSSWFELQWNGDNGIHNTINSNFNTISTLLRDILTGATDALSNLGQEFLSFIGLSSTNTLIPPAYGDTGIGLPLIYPEHEYGTVGASNISTILDLDLSQENSHVHRITAAGTITINFIGLPKAGMREFIQIEITQDDVGGHQITFNANGDPNLVQTDVDISLDPNATTTITGYVRHDSATLANFASREEPTQREEDTGGGIGNLGEWATLPASSAIDVAGNQINKIGALQFQEIAGSASSVISRHTGIDLRAGDEKTIRLLSSNVEILAEFDEDYIDLKNKTLRNLNLGNIASLIIDNSVSINKLASPASSVNHVLLSGGDNPNYWGQLNNIIGTLDGSKLLSESVPLDRLADIPSEQILASNTTGRITHTNIPRPTFVTAMTGYNPSNSIENRLSSLESDDNITTLAALDDTDISDSPSHRSYMRYSIGTQKWIDVLISNSDLPSDISGTKLLDKSVPVEKLEDLPLGVVTATDNTGRLVGTTVQLNRLNVALHDYPAPNTNSPTVNDRLNDLESDSSSISSLADIDDVTISRPVASNSFIQYEAANDRWINSQINFSEISGSLDGSEILNNSIPLGKLADLTGNRIVITDNEGKITQSSANSSILGNYDISKGGIETRFTSLESNSGGATTLAALDDTDISDSPSHRSYMRYSIGTQKWIDVLISNSDLPSDISGTKLLDKSVPVEKLEDLPLGVVTATDNTGRLVGTTVQLNRLNVALHDYPAPNTNSPTVNDRLNDLESGGGGGSTFDPISITSNLLPADDRDVQLGTAMTRFSSAYLWNLEGYAGADLRGVVHVGRDGGDGSIPGFVGIHGPTNFYNNRIANIGYETISRLSELSESSLDENNDYLAILDDSDGRGEIKKIRASAFTGGGSSSGSSFDPGNITDNLEPRSNRGVHLGASNKRFNEGHIHDLTVYDNLTVNDGITAQGVIHSTAQITTAGFITAQTNLNVFGSINHDGTKIGFRRAEPQLGTTWNLGPGLDIDERTVIAPSSQSASFTSFTLWQLLNAFNTLVSDLQLQGILL